MIFDDTNYVANFPTDPTPPQNSQTAHDKVWPFARQTLLSGVGLDAVPGLADIAAEMGANSFNLSLPVTIGHPPLVPAEKVALISGASDVPGTFPLLGMTATGLPRMFLASITAGVLTPWEEIYTLTPPFTKAYVDQVITNAHPGNIGKEGSPALVECELVAKAGFYSCGIATLNKPQDLNGELIHLIFTGASVAGQIFVVNTGNSGLMFHRSQSSGIWAPWREGFSSTTRTSAEANVILDDADTGNIGKSVTVAVVDANLDNRNKFFYIASTTLNRPPATANYAAINFNSTNGNNVFQMAVNTANGEMWKRSATSGTFTAWTQIATVDELNGLFLPLSGGTLNGGNSSQVLAIRSDTENVGAYCRFMNWQGASVGYIGSVDNSPEFRIISTGQPLIIDAASTLSLNSSNGPLNLSASTLMSIEATNDIVLDCPSISVLGTLDAAGQSIVCNTLNLDGGNINGGGAIFYGGGVSVSGNVSADGEVTADADGTPVTLTSRGGKETLGNSGLKYWQRNPDTLWRDQWGRQTSTGTAANAVTFVQPYTDIDSVNVQCTIIGDTGQENVGVTAITLTGFSFTNVSTSEVVMWRSIGL